tara:strand:+ start:316 stop:2820 length:2505 start_codon:yes stop_codon:yes gene_type:complete
MEGQIFKDINTELDLNGPYLSFTTDPSDATAVSGSVTYVGVATVSYGSVVDGPDNIGTLEYQWYEFQSGATPGEYVGTKLTDGTGISGATTNTLTVANLVSGTDDNREFYLEAQYKPAQADYKTGDAVNEPVNSTRAGLTIAPTINIISQPTTKVVNTNVETTFQADANLSDGSGAALTYQWYIDGVAETNRTKITTWTTSSSVSTPHSYSWSSDASHTLPANAYDITTEIAGAQSGGGGRDGGGPGAPAKSGKGGRFTLEAPHVQGKELQFRIGSQGSSGGSCRGKGCVGSGGQVTGSGDGTRGGGAGNRGWSGAGGGGGAASYVRVPALPGPGNIIVAGGGGGGGGGSWNRGGISHTPTGNTGNAPNFTPYNGTVPLSSGHPTGDWEDSGDGGGGGGGGGGSPGGNTGNRGHDKNHGAYTGHGGGSRYDDPRANLVRQWGQGGNGYATLSYMSTTTTVTTHTRRTVISGVNTPTLTLKSDWNGSQSVFCRISHSSASNSPVDTDTVSFTQVPGTGNEMINFEEIDGNSSTAIKGDFNLRSGAYTWLTKPGGQYLDDLITFYAPDKDIDVYIDLYGSQGDDWQPRPDPINHLGAQGGKGGYGRIEMTLKQNQEYTIAGLSTNIGTPFLYEGGELVAVVGQGGQAGRWGSGGDGGGLTGRGNTGSANGGGDAGADVNLQTNGTFGSIMQGALNTGTVASYGETIATGTNGGQAITCSKGVYWRQQGKGACDSVGTGRFRTTNGTDVTNTSSSVTRGYKAGWNVMQTAGDADQTSQVNGYVMSGRGGTGATGGEGGTNGAGGGGGSGWVRAGTTIKADSKGEHTDYAQVTIRLKS